MSPVTDEQAKAAQEVAKATGKALDVAGSSLQMVMDTVATVVVDAIGRVGGDWLHVERQRNKDRLASASAEKISNIPKGRISPPSPSLLLPLLAAAEDESRETLQDLWAALLANCMVDGGRKVRAAYFEIVRQLEPADAMVLGILVETLQVPSSSLNLGVLSDRMADYGIGQNGCQIALEALVRLNLLQSNVPLPTDRGQGVPPPTPLGRGLVAASQID